MPARVVCPACRTAGQCPDHLLGKTIRCRKCQHSFAAKASAPEEEVVTAEVVDDDPPPSPAAIQERSKAPPPAPDDQHDEAEEDEDLKPPSWHRLVRVGITLAIGVWCTLGLIVVLTVAAPFLGRLGQTVAMLIVVLALVSVPVGLVIQGLSLTVPWQHGARGWAIAGLALNVAGLIAMILAFFVADGNLERLADPSRAVAWLTWASNLLSLAQAAAWVFMLRALCLCLDENWLAERGMRLAYWGGAAMAVSLLGPFLQRVIERMAGDPEPSRLDRVGLIIIAIVYLVLFLGLCLNFIVRHVLLLIDVRGALEAAESDD